MLIWALIDSCLGNNLVNLDNCHADGLLRAFSPVCHSGAFADWKLRWSCGWQRALDVSLDNPVREFRWCWVKSGKDFLKCLKIKKSKKCFLFREEKLEDCPSNGPGIYSMEHIDCVWEGFPDSTGSRLAGVSAFRSRQWPSATQDSSILPPLLDFELLMSEILVFLIFVFPLAGAGTQSWLSRNAFIFTIILRHITLPKKEWHQRRWGLRSSGDLQCHLQSVQCWFCALFWILFLRSNCPSWTLSASTSCFLFIRPITVEYRPCLLHNSHFQKPDAVSESQPGEWSQWASTVGVGCGRPGRTLPPVPGGEALGAPLAFNLRSPLPLTVSETSSTCLLSSPWMLCLVW